MNLKHGATSGRHWVHYKPPILGNSGVETYDCLTWPPANNHMLESKFSRYVRLYQIVKSEDNQIYPPSIIANKFDNL